MNNNEQRMGLDAMLERLFHQSLLIINALPMQQYYRLRGITCMNHKDHISLEWDTSALLGNPGQQVSGLEQQERKDLAQEHDALLGSRIETLTL